MAVRHENHKITKVFTCKLPHSAAQLADAVPQVCHPGEGAFLQLVHVVGAAAAAPLAVEGTVAVPGVTGQRSLTDCNVGQQKDKRKTTVSSETLRGSVSMWTV